MQEPELGSVLGGDKSLGDGTVATRAWGGQESGRMQEPGRGY